MTKRDREYAQALDQLDGMLASGLLTQNERDVRRQRLLAEASEARPTVVMRIMTAVLALIAFLILLGVIALVLRSR